MAGSLGTNTESGSMFDKYGQPYGYGQDAPGKDLPQQAGSGPLSQAIQGNAPSFLKPGATPNTGAPIGSSPQYPADPGMLQWRQGGAPAAMQGGMATSSPLSSAIGQLSAPQQPMSALPNGQPPVGTQPLPRATPALAPPSQGGLGTSPPQGGGFNFGGGWDQANPKGKALQAALASGLSGQAAVDHLNQNPATAGVAYYPDKGYYGIDGSSYAAPNAANGGALDLIQRHGGGGGGGSAPGGGMSALMAAVSGQQQQQMQQNTNAQQTLLQQYLAQQR